MDKQSHLTPCSIRERSVLLSEIIQKYTIPVLKRSWWAQDGEHRTFLCLCSRGILIGSTLRLFIATANAVLFGIKNENKASLSLEISCLYPPHPPKKNHHPNFPPVRHMFKQAAANCFSWLIFHEIWGGRDEWINPACQFSLQNCSFFVYPSCR